MIKDGALRQSLELQVGFIFLLLALAFAAIGYVAQRGMVFPAFAKLEEQAAVGNLQRLRSMLDSELQSLSIVAREYSNWTETYDFVLGNNPSYVQVNIDQAAWGDGKDVGLMMFFDLNGSLVWGEIYDPVSRRVVPVDLSSSRSLAMLQEQVAEHSPRNDITGLVQLPEGLVMIAVNPVFRTDRSGPLAGYHVMGRYLLEPGVKDFISRSGVNFSLDRLQLERLEERPVGNFEGQHFSSGTIELQYNEDSVISTELWRDMFERDAVMAKVDTARTITALGSGILTMSALFLVCVSLVFVLFTWAWLRRLIVGPIRQMKAHMSEIRQTQDLSLSLDMNRSDEIGDLANEFDVMTTALQLTQSELQQARDEALSSAQMKSEFLASMSHEIRTPMNGVIGMTDLLFNTDLSKNQKRLVETVKTSANSLLQIINDILDFSKIDAGKMRLEEQVFTLESLMIEVNAIVTEPAQRKGLEYVCSLDADLPQGVAGDAQRLRQVLVNLLGNAIKFTESGEVVLAVKCTRTWSVGLENWGDMFFSVSDTGIGLDQSLQDKIFGSFSQADNSTTRNYGGTGLGLSICKQLVELMEGKIGFQSSVGEGAKFWFTLPMRLQQTQGESQDEPRDRLKDLRIMLVDDNATSLELLTEHTAAWDAKTDSYSSARDALNALRHAAEQGIVYDILVVDYHMPGMDGLTLVEQVNDSAYLGAPTIILLSTMSEEFSASELANLRIESFLSKPILADALYAQICRGLASEQVASKKAGHELVEGENAMDTQIDANILVAEDNLVNQELISILLEDAGCKVVIAENGQLAIAALEVQEFDLLIMDCQMPLMDGFEASRIIRDRGVTAKSGGPLPILALTANAMAGDRERCLAAGMDTYISKPFSNSELLETLRAFLPALENRAELDSGALDQVRALQREGQPNIMNRLINAYLETSPGLMAALLEGISSNNDKAIELNAHTLKSSSATLGGSKFASLCAEMEQRGRTAVTEDISELADQLSAEFRRFCFALEKEKQVEH